MTPDQRDQMQHHVNALAQILYDDAKEKGMRMTSLGEIEQTVREQVHRHVSPNLGLFLSTQASAKTREKRES